MSFEGRAPLFYFDIIECVFGAHMCIYVCICVVVVILCAMACKWMAEYDFWGCCLIQKLHSFWGSNPGHQTYGECFYSFSYLDCLIILFSYHHNPPKKRPPKLFQFLSMIWRLHYRSEICRLVEGFYQISHAYTSMHQVLRL